MKYLSMIIALSFGLIASHGYAQTCQVKDPNLVGKYSGGCVNGLAEGTGKVVGENQFQGQFKAGEPVKGTYIWANGERYEGEMSNNKRNGYGVLHYADGRSYAGNFVNNQRHGRGVLSFGDGSVYEGDFEHDSLTGTGTLTMANGSYYRGGMLNGRFEGKGSLRLVAKDPDIQRWRDDSEGFFSG